jgi:hypothetical protein
LVNLALGIGVIAYLRRRKSAARGPEAALVVISLLFILFLPSSIVLRGDWLDDTPGEIVFVEEGDLATVQVLQNAANPAAKAMTVDGCKIGWSRAFNGSFVYRKQVILAHVPMVLDTRIRTTLNVGLGSGSTLKTLSAYPALESLDCVEISASVVRAAELFDESSVLEDPRTNLIVDDAVHYLLQTDNQYDLIISDGKQNPFSSANAPLLCREYYQFCLDRLTERGMFIQWISLFTLHSDLRVNLRTLCDVFPHLDVFYFPPEAVLMVGSRQPLAGRPAMTREEFLASPAATDLAPYHIPDPAALLARWVAGKPQFERELGEGPCSTWDHMLLDFSPFKASSRDWSRARSANLQLLLDAEASQGSAGKFAVSIPAPPAAATRILRRAYLARFQRKPEEASRLANEALSVNPDDTAARALLAALARPRGRG